MLVRQGTGCRLTAFRAKDRPAPCAASPRLQWAAGGRLLTIAGNGRALVYLGGGELAVNRTGSGRLLLAPIDAHRFVLGSSASAELSFYRLVSR